MTPQQRADAYWQAQRNAEDCSLVEWFKRCENEALERVALYMDDQANNPCLDGSLDCPEHAKNIRALKHKVA